ncbi:MAG: branched-chain amino acid ABC transporter permease [Thermodesulfobacteriota bacterium]|jgi:branched-chain amino acid transport system permease protein
MTLDIVWLFRWFQESVMAVPGRVVALIFILFLFLLPLITTDPSALRIITLTSIFALYAASWDVLSGFTGQVSFGHGLFFGVSAYTSAMLNKYFLLPVWVTIPIGSFGGILVGLIAGIPALRLRGFYLGLVTLAFPIILAGIIFVFPDVTGGEVGIYGLTRLSGSPTLNYYIIVLIMICSLLIMYKLTDAGSKFLRTGLIFRAIKEDEITARASGIDTMKYKLVAFGASGFFAGIAGGLYAHYMRVAGPSTLELFFSFSPILWTIFGSMATIYGPVAGTFILFPFMEIIRFSRFGEETRYIFFAFILILFLIFMPEGLTVWVRDKIEIKCQRCKLINIMTRKYCRACRAPLHMEEENYLIKEKGGTN